ncbi:MAG: glucose-6-phosphate isomerase, partial [Bacteroidetes bacterium HGW-Bacteroidetes-15]
MSVRINLQYITNVLSQDDIYVKRDKYKLAYEQLLKKEGKGNDFLGWLDVMEKHSKELLLNIKEISDELKEKEAIVFVGIGGSYLGARAVIEALQFTELSEQKTKILYAGHHLSEDYLHNLLKYLKDKDYAVIAISKSGTTTEPAVAFRLLKQQLEQKYDNKEIAKRIIVITDKKEGALKKLADDNAYRSFIIPDDIGGRYSVLTPVGLLPIAVTGNNISELLKGAYDIKKELFAKQSMEDNSAILYAASRNALYDKGRKTELMTSFEPQLYFFIEWWKQLFGESDGKERKGIFPAGAIYTTDLHSLGQFVQEGTKNLFETVIHVDNPKHTLNLPSDEMNIDNLNYISEKRLHKINHIAEKATIM